MDLSKLRSRRNILALALAGAASRVAPVRAAQSTAGCDIGFTYGLLTIGGEDCQLLSPPGMDGANISLPIQMIDGRGSSGTTTAADGSTVSSQGTSLTGTSTTSSPSSSTTSPQAERQARLQKHRDKKRTKRGRKTDQKQQQNDRRHTKRQSRLDAQEETDRLASLKQCTDFDNQKLAFEYMSQYTDNRETLDPDRDGVPCENLPAITCKQIRTVEGADATNVDDREDAVQSWLKRYGFSTSNNPFGLKVVDGVLCPKPEADEDNSQNTQTTTEAQIVNG